MIVQFSRRHRRAVHLFGHLTLLYAVASRWFCHRIDAPTSAHMALTNLAGASPAHRQPDPSDVVDGRFVEGPVTKHGEQDVCPASGEAEQGLAVGLALDWAIFLS
ncbi:hypothetical protein [Streptomyces sp. M92]|uniref:hypothetical protein n=1 Tax=Streptomyces sp. M92 TaxID=2944250 RepID=UPI003FA7A73D